MVIGARESMVQLLGSYNAISIVEVGSYIVRVVVMLGLPNTLAEISVTIACILPI